MDDRATAPYRQTLNKMQLPCLGVTEYLDPKSIAYPKHKTLGINFADISEPTRSPTGVNRRCDDCLALQEYVYNMYFETHPDEEHRNKARAYGNKLFIYKGIEYGSISNGVFTLHNGTKIRYNYPDTYTKTTGDKKVFTTSEEFYAYLDSILEREIHQP